MINLWSVGLDPKYIIKGKLLRLQSILVSPPQLLLSYHDIHVGIGPALADSKAHGVQAISQGIIQGINAIVLAIDAPSDLVLIGSQEGSQTDADLDLFSVDFVLG